MMKPGTNKRSLLSEGLSKLSAQAGFLALLIFAFERNIRVGQIGVIAVAMVVPGLIWTWIADDVTRRFGPRVTYLGAVVLRSALFLVMPWIAKGILGCAISSGLVGLLTQAANAAKLVYDGRRLAACERAKFNASRASLGSLATILGPSLAGLVAAKAGGSGALIVTAGIGFAGALPLLVQEDAAGGFYSLEEEPRNPDTSLSVRARVLWSELAGAPDLLVVLALYILIIAILEMEYPLVLPFVKEVYGLSADAAGSLLGICGLGALLGGLAMRRRGAPLSVLGLALFLIFDGLSLLTATLAPPLLACYGLFLGMGVISSVNLVTVETRVQNSVPSSQQAAVFSLMGFVGGVGGAAFTLISTQLADWIGCGLVLRGCALFEITLSIFGMMCLVLLEKRPKGVAGEAGC